MLSRVAENLYWMARYVERAENLARFVDVNLHLMLEMPKEEAQWRPLVTVTGDEELFDSLHSKAGREEVLRFLTFDSQYPNSIVSCVRQARENARACRSALSAELWRRLNEFHLFLQAPGREKEALSSPDAFYAQVRLHGALFVGLVETTLSQGEAWHFVNLGRHLECADKTSRILDVKYYILLPRVDFVGTDYDLLQWNAVLDSVSGLEMFRQGHSEPSPARVAEFLLLDRAFPRSVARCVARAEEHLRGITGTRPGSFSNEAERRMGRLRSDLEYTKVDELIEFGLHEFVDSVQFRLNQAGQSVHAAFFDAKEGA